GAAREKLAASTELRRELGFLPGVAANLIGLAYLANDERRREDVRPLLDEAATLAEADGARGVLRWVEQARGQLLGDG
ncbi:MAG TPA: hypothetical protein VGX25_30550, partial [Actinophytocola sp.]|uniref:hypothetical protein n=1 Tax=Actinophytocola sp. TaxID=1872138 RepID=UPI002DDD2F9E